MAIEGETAEWLVALHDDVVELYHFDCFMYALRKRFSDPLAEWKGPDQRATVEEIIICW